MKSSVKIALVVLLLIATVAAVAVAVLRGRTPAPSYSADVRPTVEVYGDSIALGDSYNFQKTEVGPRTWVNYIGHDGIRFTGGFAQGGRSSGDILGEDQGSRSTFVVYALGTNDFRAEEPVPFDTFAENAREFADRQHEGERFVVVKLGPMNDRDGDEVAAWNAGLEQLAAEEGWILTDPWEGMRDSENHYIEGYNRDSFHPNEEGAKLYAENMAEQLLAQLPSS